MYCDNIQLISYFLVNDSWYTGSVFVTLYSNSLLYDNNLFHFTIFRFYNKSINIFHNNMFDAYKFVLL